MLKTIKVTRRHIRAGKSCDNYSCPIALAIKEQTGKRAYVGYNHIKLLEPGETVQYSHGGEVLYGYTTSPKCREFINKVDMGMHVNGFTFKLEIAL